jgi:peptide/nickel transport system ATP-binding protein
MSAPLLDVENLEAFYRTPAGDVRAVDGVSLQVREREIFGIAGESGCGKSTLTKAILRLLQQPAYVRGGRVRFDGRELLSLDDESLRRIRGAGLAYIPQSSMNSLNPVINIEKQMTDLILTHENETEDGARTRAKKLLRLVGLSERCARMYPHELSGGMKQRVIIGIAITLNPRLIVADEPTTALDVVTQRGILQALAGIKREFGASIMLITHDMAVHAEIADRLLVMYAGKVVEVADVRAVFSDPLHPYSEVLVAAIPSIEERREIRGVPGRPPSLLDPPAGCRFHPRCPRALSVCRQEEPLLREVRPGRFVACHLHMEHADG